MLATALLALALSSAPDAGAAAKTSWKSVLAASKFPAHLIEVTPRSNFAIIYGCDDGPVLLKLDGTHLSVAYFQSGHQFEVTDFAPSETPAAYVMTIRPQAKPKDPTSTVVLRLLNPALGIWAITSDDGALFTGRKTFVDEAQSKAVKTIRPAQGECSSTLGAE